ncbi:uncharacterized protein LOC143361655 [Halictus rubicundus]|uniref:uncharacterized protein LOC143361655 n=1 Tax=Halictus rubicundus TaxID=77578 RepID=UPI004036BAED
MLAKRLPETLAMDVSIILSITVALLGLYYYLTREEEDPLKRHGLPFKRSVPVLGSTWRSTMRLKSFAETVEEVYNMSPEAKYVGLRHRMTSVVMIRDPELVKSIGIKHFDRFPDHRTFRNTDIDPFFSKNLLLLEGERWKEVRSLLSPAFTSSRMRTMFKLMSECAANVANHLAALPDGERVTEVKDIFTRFANDVFASCAFGISVDSMTDKENRFYALGREALDLHSGGFLKLFTIVVFPRLAKMLGLRIIRKEVADFFEEVVSANIATRERTGLGRPDFIQLMMESRGKLGPGKQLTNLDIAGQAFTFYFGGFETTSSLLCFAAHELAANPETQKRLHEEIDQVLKDCDGDVSYEAINGMKYLDAVINEALRMYPVIPITDRECKKAFELPPALPGLKPLRIDKGSHVWLPIYGIQRDPKYFKEPGKFDPSRFTDKESSPINSAAYLPFGIGPRICVGYRFAIMQSRVALFHILRSCELKVSSRTSLPMQIGTGGAFLKAKNGFWLEILPRNNPLVLIERRFVSTRVTSIRMLGGIISIQLYKFVSNRWTDRRAQQKVEDKDSSHEEYKTCLKKKMLIVGQMLRVLNNILYRTINTVLAPLSSPESISLSQTVYRSSPDKNQSKSMKRKNKIGKTTFNTIYITCGIIHVYIVYYHVPSRAIMYTICFMRVTDACDTRLEKLRILPYGLNHHDRVLHDNRKESPLCSLKKMMAALTRLDKQYQLRHHLSEFDTNILIKSTAPQAPVVLFAVNKRCRKVCAKILVCFNCPCTMASNYNGYNLPPLCAIVCLLALCLNNKLHYPLVETDNIFVKKILLRHVAVHKLSQMKFLHHPVVSSATNVPLDERNRLRMSFSVVVMVAVNLNGISFARFSQRNVIKHLTTGCAISIVEQSTCQGIQIGIQFQSIKPTLTIFSNSCDAFNIPHFTYQFLPQNCEYTCPSTITYTARQERVSPFQQPNKNCSRDHAAVRSQANVVIECTQSVDKRAICKNCNPRTVAQQIRDPCVVEKIVMVDMLSVTLALVVGAALYYYLKGLTTFFKDRGIPEARSVPLFGSLWKVLLQQRNFAEIVNDIYKENPDTKYIGVYDFSTPMIMIRDPELIKSVTVKNFEHFQDHRSLKADDIEPMFSKNLFALTGERWKEVRNLLSPAFTSSKMKAMFKLMRECAVNYGNYFATLPEKDRCVELKDAFTRYTNDVIATCAFGINVDSMANRENTFYVYGRKSTSFGRWQSFKFFLVRWSPWLCKVLGVTLFDKMVSKFFVDLIGTTIKTRDEKGIVRPDMIQLMMETRGKMGPGKELTIEDMTAQAFIFFFGGFESTSTLMCFAAYEVGVNAEVQKRLHEEIDEVLEANNGEATYEAINDMKYLDAIINEALRMYPVIVAVDRVCTKPFELPPAMPGLKPHVVQKDEYLWIPIYGIQYDSQYYEEPTKFMPERFLDDPKKILNSGTYLSFGLGPRMCIGNRFALLEAKVLLFQIFSRCTLKPNSKTPIPMVLSRKGFQMTAKDGFWFDVEPRKVAPPVLVNSVSNGSAIH